MIKLEPCEEREKIISTGSGFAFCNKVQCPLHKPDDTCRLWRECEIGKTYCCLQCNKSLLMDKVC